MAAEPEAEKQVEWVENFLTSIYRIFLFSLYGYFFFLNLHSLWYHFSASDYFECEV